MCCANGIHPRWLICLIAALGLAAGGCRMGSKYGTGESFRPVPPPQNEMRPTGFAPPIPASDPYSALETYLLRVGDEIQFTLSVDSEVREGSYRLLVHDLLTVEYLHEPVADRRARTVRVLPNGTIDLPLIGTVAVAGKSVEEAQKELNERAGKYYRFPQIVIAVSETSGRAEELRRAFTSGFSNQSLTVVVNPDGTINLPEAGTLRVFGRTLPDVREQANDLYARLVPGVRVWPHLTRRAPDQVFVLGQVKTPGRYLLDRPTHVSQAIAQAGGYLLGSELHAVVLIRYREGCPRAVKLDLHSAIHQDYKWGHSVDLKDDILLADGDVIVIPRDAIEDTDDIIRRVFTLGLYGVVPTYDITVGHTPLHHIHQ